MFAKATEGTDFADAHYADYKLWAAQNGIFFGAYHFLRTGNEAAQAAWCYQHVGGEVPLMVDVEKEGTDTPDIHSIIAFINAYRAKGGNARLVYLPHWYWVDIGSPDLSWMNPVGLYVVSSNYPANGYSDNGPGWTGYGGINPLVWQYTDNNGGLDYNAFRGPLSDFKTLMGVDMADGLTTDQKIDQLFTNANNIWVATGHNLGEVLIALYQRTAFLDQIQTALSNGGTVTVTITGAPDAKS